MCIKLHGIIEGLLVIDPFSGIGSTAIASIETRISIDRGYIDEAMCRIRSSMALRGLCAFYKS